MPSLLLPVNVVIITIICFATIFSSWKPIGNTLCVSSFQITTISGRHNRQRNRNQSSRFTMTGPSTTTNDRNNDNHKSNLILAEDDDYMQRQQITQLWIDSFSNQLNNIRTSSTDDDDEEEARIHTFVQNHFFEQHDDDNKKRQCYWRDMVFYTWNIITMHGYPEIQSFLRSYNNQRRSKQNRQHLESMPDEDHDQTQWELDDNKDILMSLVDVNTNENDSDSNQQPTGTKTKMIEFWCHLRNNVSIGRAHVRLIKTSSAENDHSVTSSTNNSYNAWKAKTVLTVITELIDRPFAIGRNRNTGLRLGPIPNRIYWHDDPKQLKNVNNYYYNTWNPNSNTNNNGDGESNNQQPKPSLIPSRISHNEVSDETVDETDDSEYYVVIIGGGQAGLSLGARLQLLNIPYIIIESHSSVGMSWMKRYPSLYLHDPCYYNHMPYIEFPSSWPIYCPRNKIATWLQSYATTLDLNVQTNARVVSTEQQQQRQKDSENSNIRNNDSKSNAKNGNSAASWTVTVEITDNTITNEILTDNEKGSVTTTTIDRTKRTKLIKAHHIVFATGNSSHPRMPSFPSTFRGILFHSSKYCGGKHLLSLLSSDASTTTGDSSNSKKSSLNVVVIGSNNSAFDICQDIWEQLVSQYTNLKITMIQRSPSMVVSPDSVLNIGLGPLYRQDAPFHHEEADFIATTVPFQMALEKNWIDINNKMKINDRELHSKLINAGYELDTDGPNGTGIFAKSATEGGGFYINMGCAELIIDKHVDVVYGSVLRLDDDSVIVQNKRTNLVEQIPADVVIYATGYGTMDQWVKQICGKDISDQVGKTWGLGLGYNLQKDPGPWEGELRNMWKPTTIDGLWFQGGNLAQNRHYSRFLALQLAARYIEIDTAVYGIPNPTTPLP